MDGSTRAVGVPHLGVGPMRSEYFAFTSLPGASPAQP